MSVIVIRPEDRELRAVSSKESAAPQDVLNQSRRQLVSETDPFVQIAQLSPGSTVPPHSHTASEATIVLSGRVRLAGVECGPGSLFVVPANEAYGLEVIGDEPLTFVVVRPAASMYETK
jgi:quercetin dioxygenase-like cupin family protein